MKSYVVLLLLWGIVSSGCSLLSPRPGDHPVINHRSWPLHLEAMRQLHAWRMQGRIAVQTAQQNWTANIYWAQFPDHYEIRLVLPFGQGSYEILGGAETVRLSRGDGQYYHAASVEALLEERLGWAIELTSLGYWLKGIPDPAVAIDGMGLNEQNLLATLQQHDARIDISRYRQVENRNLPRKIVLNNKQLSLKLVVHRWEI